MTTQRIRGCVPSAAIVMPPGGYGDGPVYVRVHRDRAGGAWPQPAHDIELDDQRCSADPVHHYVAAENSHNAFIYAQWIAERGVPTSALAVVRLAESQQRYD